MSLESIPLIIATNMSTLLKHVNRAITSILTAAVILMLPCVLQSEDWVTVESEEFDVQFDIPESWELEFDGDTVTAFGNGIAFVLTAVKDNSITTEELFEIQVEELEIESEGEVEEIELQGGIIGLFASGAGIIDDEVTGIMLLAATMDENNYLAYVFAAPKKFERKIDLISGIITSLAPLGFEE